MMQIVDKLNTTPIGQERETLTFKALLYLDVAVHAQFCRLFCVVYLTNGFYIAVRLFSNRSEMTSECGKNKKVAHEAIAECVTDVLTTF